VCLPSNHEIKGQLQNIAARGRIDVRRHHDITIMSNNPRENHIDYVEFPAQSAHAFASAKQFYQEVFGWSFQDWGNDYSDTKDSGIACGFSADASHRPSVPLVVLFTADLEAVRERVIKAGGKISKDIVSFPGGRRFQYIDPAGNQLGVWSDK
jgi:predicted enzyme related to lactoylglutathione lyase